MQVSGMAGAYGSLLNVATSYSIDNMDDMV